MEKIMKVVYLVHLFRNGRSVYCLWRGAKRVSSYMGDRRNILKLLTEEAYLFVKLVACAYMTIHMVWSSNQLSTLSTHYYQYYRWMWCSHNAIQAVKISSNGFPPKYDIVVYFQSISHLFLLSLSIPGVFF